MIKRILAYLQEMFPPLHMVATLTYAITFYIMLSVNNKSPLLFHFHLVHGAISLLSMILLIRIMDEFKDYEDDLKNFPTRPLPSGRVKKKDLKYLGIVCFILPLIMNLNNLNSFLGIILCLSYSLLMLKWFFIEEKMKKNLPLAFISHHPIVFFYLLYLYFVYLTVFPETNIATIWPAIPIGLLSTNWEISRKLRAPKDETNYTTYSKIWGYKKASFISIFIQFVAFSGFIIFMAINKSPLWFILLFTILWSINTLPYLNFLRNFSNKQSLKLYAERFSVLTQLMLIFIYFNSL